MLTKKNRLTKDKEFTNVFKKGKASYDKIIGVKVVKNSKEVSRFGVIVSKKISKKAVERNRIKRQIRAIIQENLNKTTGGYDVAVITLPEVKQKDFPELKKSLILHFKRLKLYK